MSDEELKQQLRRATDDKIFEMHGTISGLAATMERLEKDMKHVPLNAAKIVQVESELKQMKEKLEKVEKEQKLFEQVHSFFRVGKWVLGFIIAAGGAFAVFKGWF